MKVIIKLLFVLFFTYASVRSSAQILGGGTTYATAVTFNQSWLVSCPGSGTSLCNTISCEPTTAMDACGGIAPACATGTTGSDVWFKFYAQASTATIVVNPTSAFDIAIQAFSGSTCGTLVAIGCVDVTGNNQIETLLLTGLTAGQLYHFRIFGATSSVGARTGNYNFCGSASLGSAPLPVSISGIQLSNVNNRQCISWTADGEREIDSYNIEYSSDGINFSTVGSVAALNDARLHKYNYCDAASRTKGLYRIKIIENSGEVKYSYVVRVQAGALRTVQVYPNPAGNYLYVELPATVSENRLTAFNIVSTDGRNIKSGTINSSRTIDVHELKPGFYLLQISNENGVNTFQFQKQ